MVSSTMRFVSVVISHLRMNFPETDELPYLLFSLLLRFWALFDSNPPFTASQLKALTAGDAFEVIDWPSIFGVQPTPFAKAIHETFNDPEYSRVALEF